MQLTLRRALTGAFLACLTTTGALWPSAQAQNDIAPPASGTPAIMTGKPGDNPTPANSLGDVLHDNGPFVNLPGGGSGGADASVLQGSLTMTVFGFGHSFAAGVHVADDFEVPASGWDINEMIFYAYQTGSTTTSTMNLYYVQIWDGVPGAPGSTVIYGDLTTNRFVSSTWSNTYRVTETTLTNTQRPIMMTTTAVDVTLPAGTYWVEWTTGGSLASGPWAPPITINGQTTTGNGMQLLSGVWGPLTDVGPQGLPFQIIGTALGGGGCVPSATVFCSTDTPLAIPDGNPTGVTSTINVAPLGSLIIDDLDVGFQVTHTWMGDVLASLAHGATTVAIFDRPGVPASTFGCSGNNADIVLDDEGTDGAVETSCVDDPAPEAYPVAGGRYTPNNPLSGFDGVDASGSWALTVADLATPDSGTLDSWWLAITPGSGAVTYTSTDTPIAIPDSPDPGIVSTIIVPPSVHQVLDVDVHLDITHSWAGDIIGTVAHGAASSTIYDRPGRTTTGFGCSGDNPDLVIDDEGTGGPVETSCLNANPAYLPGVNYTPNNPLNVFDGLNVEGAWTLTVSDAAGGDTGSLDSWSIIVTEDLNTSGPNGPVAGEASLRVLPNPMSASGTIELSVPTSQAVRVAVYDMLGREVMVVLDRDVTAAQRVLINVAAQRLGAGVYVVRAAGESFEMIQRLTVSR